MTWGPQTDPIISAFDRQVADSPERTLVMGGMARYASVAEVDASARAAQSVLTAAGLAGGGLVLGLRAPNGPGFLAAFLACRRAGHLVALLDDHAPGEEIARVVAGLGIRAVLRAHGAWACGPDDFTVDRSSHTTVEAIGPDAFEGAAVIKLTSGSTGGSRGVVATSAALVADDRMLRAAMGIGVKDRVLAAVPFAHSYGLSSLVVPALVGGIPLIVSDGVDPFDPLRAAARYEATVLPTSPAWIATLLRLAAPPRLPPSLRLIVSAGAPLLPQTASDFRRRLGRPVHVFYGASECGGITYDRSGEAGERGTVGQPIEGVTLELAALDGFEASTSGRVVVESPAVGSSYFPQSDPRLAGGRFVSQDVAVRRGTELQLVCRLDDLINVRGSKVNPAEVERVIAEHGAVQDVVVYGTDSGRPGDPYVRAVVACPDGSLTGDDIVAWCRARLSDYKVPRSVVVVATIPRTLRGKVDREALTRLPGPSRRADA